MSFALLSGKCRKQIAVLIGSIPGYLVLAEVMSFAHLFVREHWIFAMGNTHGSDNCILTSGAVPVVILIVCQWAELRICLLL